MFLKSEEAFGILRRESGHRCRGCATQLGDLFHYERYVLRFVDFSSERNRSEIGAIGFDQESVLGNVARHLLNLKGVFEGYDARNPDVKSKFQENKKRT